MSHWETTGASDEWYTPKIKFLRPDGSVGRSPSNGTTLWAAGEQGKAALLRSAAAGLGIVARPAFPPVEMRSAA